MAREVSSPERKRGRISNASRQSDASQVHAETVKEQAVDNAGASQPPADEKVKQKATQPRTTNIAKDDGKQNEASAPQGDGDGDGIPNKRGRKRASIGKNQPTLKTNSGSEARPVKSKRGSSRTGDQNTASETRGVPEKRKRGRPSLATKTSRKGADEAVGDKDDASEPRKKSRRSLRNPEARDESRAANPREQLEKITSGTISKQAKYTTQKTKRKRQQPSIRSDTSVHDDDDAEQEQEQGTEEPAKKKKRRGRPSLQDLGRNTVQNPPVRETEEPAKKKTRRGRPSLQDLGPNTVQNPQEQELEEPAKEKRRRGRPSLQDLGPNTVQNSQEQELEEPAKEKRRRGRPSLQDLGPNTVQNPQVRETEESGLKKRKRGRPSLEKAKDGEQSQKDQERDTADHSSSPSRPYIHIASIVETIKPSTINSKWSSLTNPSLIAASSLLDTAKYPILQRMSTTTNRRVHTTDALHLITKRISRKLTRGLPFPPSAIPATTRSSSSLPPAVRGTKASVATDSGRATEFDFESVLNARNLLERQLEPVLSAVEVLRREKVKEEKQLQMDYDLLKQLKNDVRVQGREQRALLKRAHVLAPDEGVKKEDEKDHIKIVDGLGDIFKNLDDDEEMQSLAIQLQGHVESIKGNIHQVGNVMESMSVSKAVLQNLLISHLDQASYDKVVLGL